MILPDYRVVVLEAVFGGEAPPLRATPSLRGADWYRYFAPPAPEAAEMCADCNGAGIVSFPDPFYPGGELDAVCPCDAGGRWRFAHAPSPGCPGGAVEGPTPPASIRDVDSRSANRPVLGSQGPEHEAAV